MSASRLGSKTEDEIREHTESDFRQVASMIHSSFGVWLTERAKLVGEVVYAEAFEIKAREMDLQTQAFQN
jgi:hypothetical protein